VYSIQLRGLKNKVNQPLPNPNEWGLIGEKVCGEWDATN